MAASFLGGDTLIFAIDPGSEKTGTAVVADDGSLVTKAIVPTPELGDYLSHIYENYPFSHIVMGDGTNHKKLQPLVERVVGAHPDKVAAYREGRTNLLGFFMGQVMKASGGKADPERAKTLVRNHLSA